MQTSNFDPKAFMQLIRVIYSAQIVSFLLFLLVALYISKNSPTFEFNLEDPFTIIVLFTLIAIPVGYVYSNKIFKSYESKSTLKEKLPKFQLGLITRLAFIQGAGLFSIVCLLLSSNLYFLIFTAFALIVMILNYPTPDKIGETMDLTPTEIELLKK
ncbi:MAG: hypothetical protein AB9888_11670 [Bacteroidales bacterium]